jgi:lipooligosaccharide transport system permease protein
MSQSAPQLSWRLLRVWRRDWLVTRKSWLIGFMTPLLEPILYITSLGFGFRILIPEIQYEGHTLTYVVFMAPAIIATNIMYTAFMENSFSSFVRMYYQKTYDAIRATPLSVDEIIAGEIMWGATKSLMAATIMVTVLSLFGLVHYPTGLGLLPLAFLGGLLFGAIGMLFTAFVKSIDMFNLPIFLLITPMYLFSGTFFPLENLPDWAQSVAWALPLTHLVSLTRNLCLGTVSWMNVLVSGGYLLAATVLLVPLALRLMRRRLIK